MCNFLKINRWNDYAHYQIEIHFQNMWYRRRVRSKELPCFEVPKHKGDNSSGKR
jgi:hypothetical protein